MSDIENNLNNFEADAIQGGEGYCTESYQRGFKDGVRYNNTLSGRKDISEHKYVISTIHGYYAIDGLVSDKIEDAEIFTKRVAESIIDCTCESEKACIVDIEIHNLMNNLNPLRENKDCYTIWEEGSELPEKLNYIKRLVSEVIEDL